MKLLATARLFTCAKNPCHSSRANQYRLVQGYILVSSLLLVSCKTSDSFGAEYTLVNSANGPVKWVPGSWTRLLQMYGSHDDFHIPIHRILINHGSATVEQQDRKLYQTQTRNTIRNLGKKKSALVEWLPYMMYSRVKLEKKMSPLTSDASANREICYRQTPQGISLYPYLYQMI
jgi:hypothetical protein